MTLPDPSAPILTQALACARLAALAYEPPHKLTGNPHPVRFTHDNDSGFIVDGEKCVVVAIAGSNDLGDWWKNLRCDFSAARLAEVIREIGIPFIHDKPWYFTGHSRGGGVAQHLAGELNPKCPTFVHTFGTPRSARREYLARGIQTSWILPGDPVPLVPFWSRGWVDPGTRMYLHEFGADDEWPWELFVAAKHSVEFAVRWRLLGRSSAVNWSAELHHIRHYVRRLETLTVAIANG